MMRPLAILAGLGVLAASVLLNPPQGLSASGAITLALLMVMALWWFTEALPVTATAMLPFVVLPLTGVATVGATAATYMSPIIFLVLGGALLALAIERCGLHRRIAVAVLRTSSGAARSLLLAFMVVTAFLSMWISNTATALIVMPIGLAVLAAVLPERHAWNPQHQAFATALVLGIAYAATVGGLGTLVGSPTNAIATALIERSLGVHVSFLEWLAFGVPLVLFSIPAAWWLLTRVSFRFELPGFDRDRVLASIGGTRPLSSAERRLVPILLLAVAAWVAMPLLKSVPMLAALDDSIVAIVTALVLFVVPAGDGHRLLQWSDAQRAPWDVLLLFGGGLALAEAITITGLGKWIGAELGALYGLPPALFVLLVIATLVIVTEFASNVAAASSFVPVAASLATSGSIDPLWIVLPASLAATWGFMMPAGTPPNAIAFGTGLVTVPRMIRAGVWMDLLGLLTIPAAVGFALTVLP